MKIVCGKCGAKMPYIPDKNGFICLQCGNTNPYLNKKRRRNYNHDDHYYEEY